MTDFTAPAFPITEDLDKIHSIGLTKLEWFAGMAMIGDWAKYGRPIEFSDDRLYHEKCVAYYRMAEHMLAESEKRNSSK